MRKLTPIFGLILLSILFIVIACAGDEGLVGSMGNQGDQGPAGPQGQQGDQGSAGSRGQQGEQGPAGPQGQQGEQGPRGPTAPLGDPLAPLEATGAAIDVHTHLISAEHVVIGHGAPPGSPASDAGDLISRLDEANVDRAVVLSTAYVGPEEAMSAENDWVAAEIAKFPDRLSGFCGIHPLHDTAVEEIGRCLDLPGMIGIKLHLAAPNLKPIDMTNEAHVAALSAVFDEIQERDAPVLIDVATPLGLPLSTDGFSNFATVILSHPDVRVVLAHCASEVDPELIEVWIRVGSPNIYVDVAACLKFHNDAPLAKRELIVWRLKGFGLERVFFGSDYLFVQPVESPKEALETLTKYPFTQDEVDTILNNDASVWLFGP